MRLLVDAQLPRRLPQSLATLGHDALHTLDLPMGNASPDRLVAASADDEGRIVVTKDSDFISSHLATGRSRQVLIIGTGNIGNEELVALLLAHIAEIERAFGVASLVELRPDRLIVR